MLDNILSLSFTSLIGIVSISLPGAPGELLHQLINVQISSIVKLYHSGVKLNSGYCTLNEMNFHSFAISGKPISMKRCTAVS